MHISYAVPMPEETFDARIVPLTASSEEPLSLSITGRGQLSVQGGAWQYQAEREPYSIVCAQVTFTATGRLEPVVLSLVCGGCSGHRCYDGTCDADEDAVSCPADCLTQASTCGDFYCQGLGEQAECIVDCRCDDQLCAMREPGADLSSCMDLTDMSGWGVCQHVWNPEPCDGNEPYCLSHGGEGAPDEMILRCDPETGTRIERGCDQECWDLYGTAGICDLGGTEECVCL